MAEPKPAAIPLAPHPAPVALAAPSAGGGVVRAVPVSSKDAQPAAADGAPRKKKRPLTDDERREREVNRRAQHQLISHWRMERKGHERPDEPPPPPPKMARPQRPLPAAPPALLAPPVAPLSAPQRALFVPPLDPAAHRPPHAPSEGPSVMEPRVSVAPPGPPPLLPPLMSPSSFFHGSPVRAFGDTLRAPRASSVPPERPQALDSLASMAALAPPVHRASPTPTTQERAIERRKPS